MTSKVDADGGVISEVRVCKQKDFNEDGARQLFKHGSRNIAVFNIRGNYYAIDNACYHHGGPLHNGDVEDMGGHPCIICPWHSYRIALDTGEGLYRGINMSSKKEEIRSKGIKQRAYDVKVDADGYVVVMVDLAGNIESDTYATMSLANQESASRKPTTQTNNLRNIHSSIGCGGIGTGGPVVVASGGSHLDKQTANKLASTDVPHVRCIAQEPLSADCTTVMFSFALVDNVDIGKGHDLRPGQWVTLELPVTLKEASSTPAGGLRRRKSSNVFSVQSALSTKPPKVLPQHDDDGNAPDSKLERTYTVLGASTRGGARHEQNSYGWFSIAVKNISGSAHSRSGGYGSQWLHHQLCALSNDATPSPKLRLVERGGSFSIALNRTLINNRHGRVVLISAGIGITPIIASIREMLNDGFTSVSGPALHMLHLHIDATIGSVPLLNEMLHYRRILKSKSIKTDPVTYQFRLACTRQESLDSVTPKYLTVGPREVAVDSGVKVNAATEKEDSAEQSPFAAMLAAARGDSAPKGSSATGPKDLVKDGAKIFEDLSDMQKHGHLTFGKRPEYDTVFGSMLHDVYGDAVTAADTVVMVCGPEEMIEAWTKAARAAGAQFNSVLSEKFDF